MRAAGSRLAEGFYPIFLHTLYAGRVPPFSDFLLAILEVYQIQLLHLHPNSILILAIFAYFCETYIGIHPSVALFSQLLFSSEHRPRRAARLRLFSHRHRQERELHPHRLARRGSHHQGDEEAE